MLLAANARTVNGTETEPLRVYTRTGNGSYASTWSSPELDWGRAVAWADYDKDGDMDFVVGNAYLSLGHNRIYKNKGDGTFEVAWTAPSTAYTSAVAWDDVDGDGDLDVLAGVDSGVRVYRNDGVGFSSTDAISVGGVSDIDVRDIDGDGDRDLALAGGGNAYVYTNNGGGTYALAWTGPSSVAIRFADYDKDGDMDLAISPPRGLEVYQRDHGTYTRVFSASIDLPQPMTASASKIEWFDYDGDGDLDIVAACCESPASGGACGATNNRIFKNTGGTFSMGWTASEIETSTSVSVADFDNDGKPDLAFGNRGTPNRIYQNNGGSFTPLWQSAESENTNAIAWTSF